MDELDVPFPFEIVVPGDPVSAQGSPASKAQWMDRVRAAAVGRLDGYEFAFQGPLGATIFYFPDAEMQGDVDNLVKPILDALEGPIYVNDRQIERAVVQKFEPERIASFPNPSGILALALSAEKPVVYIRIDREFDREGAR